MKLYTGFGDRGETNAPFTGKAPKWHPCVEFVGDLDEAESFVSLAAETLRQKGRQEYASLLDRVQEMLFRIGFHVWRISFGRRGCITLDDVRVVENLIDRYWVGDQHEFRMHGGSVEASVVAVARSVVRRAERSFWKCISEHREISEELLLAGKLLNRLSDLLYAIETRISIGPSVTCEEDKGKEEAARQELEWAAGNPGPAD